jgi:2-hydroxy-6-oxonona-2,4-dienedioate hydrolase
MRPPASRFLDVAGVRTRYLDAGDGEPVLLIHGGEFGGFDLAEDWLPVIERRPGQLRMIALDCLGCGFTDNPASDDDYVLGSVVAHCRAFLAALGLDSAHLVGHSRGGYVATRLALESPELARSLTIVSSASLCVPPNPIYLDWYREAERIADVRERVRYLVTVNSFSGEHVDDVLVDAMAAAAELPKTREAAAKLDGGLRDRLNADLAERLAETRDWITSGRLRQPTLVMWGYQDPSATFHDAGLACLDLVLGNVAGSRMHVLNEAGHYCYRERPDEFGAILAGFVTSWPRP